MATPSLELEKEVDPSNTNTNTNTNEVEEAEAITSPSKTPKKRKPLGIFITSILGRNRSFERKVRSPVAQRDPERPLGRPWKNILCGLRPLHQQLDQQSPQTPRARRFRRADTFNDVSSSSSWSSATESSATESLNSRYASAVDMQALDDGSHGESNATDKLISGQNSIDIKAEAFIARFYEQNLHEIQQKDGRLEY